MIKRRKDEYQCPLEVTMEIIGGKYKGVIIGHLINKTLRYNELQKQADFACNSQNAHSTVKRT